jgi:uncharacterized protein involved in response to NO
MPPTQIEITAGPPERTEAGEADEPDFPRYNGPAFFSYGFRPFFFCAALFGGVAVPAWVAIVAGVGHPDFLYAPRDWHVHEMLFGFLPAVITGFLLTAIPNWTGRPPVRGIPLMSLLVLWLAGRLLLAAPWPGPVVSAIVDGAFLVLLAAIVWREIAAGGSWSHAPIGVLISLYACANVLFHGLALRGAPTDLSERAALALDMLLLTVIGGRLIPNFTREFMVQARMTGRPASFSPIDGLSIVIVVFAAITWIVQPESIAAGGMLAAAGMASLVRLWRWRGWMTWREPLVLILHLGYGWLALSMLSLGGAIFGIGLPLANAVHVLTTGAVGAMTLAVMTRASLGHTGRPRKADPMTVFIYVLVNVGAMLRVFTPSPDVSTTLTNFMLGLAAVGWSGAYVLFALVYGPYLLRPDLDE